jgi:hypothetical protein
MNMKTCGCCGEELPATNEYFHRNARKKDGLQAWCKSCNNRESGTRHIRQGAHGYALVNRHTGDMYIGSTTQRLQHRINRHFSYAWCGKTSGAILECIRQYPEKSDWEVRVLADLNTDGLTVDMLRAAEQEAIDIHNPSLNLKAAQAENYYDQ